MKIRLLILFSFLTVLRVSAQQWGDYTLIALQNQSTATLIDTNGTTVKTWTFTAANKTGYSTYMMPGGTLVRTVAITGTSFSGGPICGKVQKVDWNGNVIWDYTYSTTAYCTHHDICPMPNGNVLLIAYERKTAAEVAAAGCTGFSGEMWPDKIVEVQPTGATTGTIVWEWHAWDHLVQNVDAAKANYQTSIVNHPELLNINQSPTKDWMHMNGVDYNPILDQVIFSSHNLSEWFIIDHSTTTAEAASHTGGNAGRGGDFLYRWGHPTNYGATGTQILNVTHDAHWIPEDVPHAGDIVGFNNKGVSSSQSSVDRVTSPRTSYNYILALGSAFTPSTYTARLACTGYSSNMGNSQQLPNGNQLVCVATSGLVYEVDPNGTTLWSKTTSGSCPQAFRYDTCYALHAAPAIPTISQAGADLSSTAGATYQWYYNGDLMAGVTTQTITPTQSGIYVVRVTDNNSCQYSYSPGFKFTLATGLAEELAKALVLYPNPSTGMVELNNTFLLSGTYTLSAFDAVGKRIATAENQPRLDLSGAPNGVYSVLISDASGMTVKKKIVIVQ